MTDASPLDQVYEDLRNTRGVEFRPNTEADKQRMLAIFKTRGICDENGKCSVNAESPE